MQTNEKYGELLLHVIGKGSGKLRAFIQQSDRTGESPVGFPFSSLGYLREFTGVGKEKGRLLVFPNRRRVVSRNVGSCGQRQAVRAG